MKEKEIRTLFYSLANKIDELYRPYTRDNFIGGEFVDDNIESLINGTYFEPKVEEIVYPFTAYYLQKRLTWEQFCELTGLSYYSKNEGFIIDDSKIFYIKESDIEKYNL